MKFFRLLLSLVAMGCVVLVFIMVGHLYLNKHSSPSTTLPPTSQVVSNTYSPTLTQTTTPTVTASPVHPATPVPVYSNPAVYHVTRTLTLTNSGAPTDMLGVWVPAIGTWDSQTGVTPIETTPGPSNTSDESYGSVLYWVFYDEPGNGSSIVISDEYTYTCYAIDYEVDPGKISAYDKTSSDYQTFTKSEKYIESDDAGIKDTAEKLQQGKTNPYDTAKSIYNWVMQNLTYQEVNGLKGAKFAWANRYGECGDYSALFCALCRADGIPARPVVGRWTTSYTSGASTADQGWHVWAEFYLPGYGWLPVDPTEGQAYPKTDYFGKLDNQRLIFHKDFSMVLEPTPSFIGAQVGMLQTFYWEYQGPAEQVSPQANITYTFVKK
jgi:transglutaminase-like putative cysteine protease